MGAAWGWWEGPDPLQMFPPSNQAALLTSCSSAFAFQWHRAKSCPYSPCSPCPQPLGKWCPCGRDWAGWAVGACVLVARGCWRSSWSLTGEWGVLGLGLPWARDTAGMAERNGDQGGDGERAAGLPRSALTLLGQGRPPPVPIPFTLCRELHKCLSLLFTCKSFAQSRVWLTVGLVPPSLGARWSVPIAHGIDFGVFPLEPP